MRRRDFVADGLALMAAAGWVSCAKGSAVHSWPNRTLVGYLRTNWSQDPFSFGSYSYNAVAQREDDREVLERPISDRVFFAGEALNPRYQSSVHAAHESGLRAADFVLGTSASRVAIIGAGMSGLTAAQALSHKGVGVTVFEARNRIGGRLWTDRSLGVPVDLGASWIHGPRGNPLTDLANQAGLNRVRTGDDFVIRGDGGQRIRPGRAPNWLFPVVGDATTGVEADQLSERYLEEVFSVYGIGYSGPDVLFPDGYSKILEPLRGDYRVELNSPVARVVHRADGVTLGLDGRSADFDAVIVTVPLGVLKQGRITFDPALGNDKQGAIDRMGMGLLDKLYLRFDVPFWDEDITNIFTPDNGLPQGQFNFWLNLYKVVGVPILLGFNGASPAHALAAESDEAVLERALRTLDGAYPT